MHQVPCGANARNGSLRKALLSFRVNRTDPLICLSVNSVELDVPPPKRVRPANNVAAQQITSAAHKICNVHYASAALRDDNDGDQSTRDDRKKQLHVIEALLATGLHPAEGRPRRPCWRRVRNETA